MRVLIALDKFKEALPAPAACEAVAAALRARHPGWTLDLCPLADGGDGFVAALAGHGRGEPRRTRVTGPLGEPVEAEWALLSADGTAALELAACSGLALVPRGRRDPWRSTTRGVGELILAAARGGASSILLGLGGSATNDLGLGALAALGWRFLDSDGRELASPVPANFSQIVRIQPPASAAGTPPLPPIRLACDVTNPLLGPRGATHTFGPQKGLAPSELPLLDAELARLAGLLAAAAAVPPSLFDRPGAGAAGGIAAGLMAGLGAELVGGFELVADRLGLERRLAAADLVITGEGAFDDTSLDGKGPGGLVRAALARGKRTLVFAGRIQVAAPPPGLELVTVTPPGMPLAEALPATARLLGEAAARVVAAPGDQRPAGAPATRDYQT